MTYQFELSPEDFAYLQNMAFEYTGINLNETKKTLIYNRLVKRLRTLGLPDFGAYCKLLKTGDVTESRYFIDAITTTVTAFFRENYHFQYLKDVLLPELLDKKPPTQPLRIWSAGCSSGEEAYSIAIVVSEAVKDQGRSIEVVATDINTDALTAAKEGVYHHDRIADIDLNRKKSWFLKGVGGNQGYVQVKPPLRSMVTFKELNLIGEWSWPYKFDIIFCRNVVIYFNKEIQRILFNRFAEALDAEGIMIVGHSESLYKISHRFKHIHNNIYRKIA